MHVSNKEQKAEGVWPFFFNKQMEIEKYLFLHCAKMKYTNLCLPYHSLQALTDCACKLKEVASICLKLCPRINYADASRKRKHGVL